jgi:hypothetical protein
MIELIDLDTGDTMEVPCEKVNNIVDVTGVKKRFVQSFYNEKGNVDRVEVSDDISKMNPELPTIKKLIFEQEECVINKHGKSEIKWVKFAECPASDISQNLTHPAAGLQFSGEPTERALRARDAHFAVQHWMDKCVKYPAEVPMNVDLDVVTSLDTLETILEALKELAKERR